MQYSNQIYPIINAAVNQSLRDAISTVSIAKLTDGDIDYGVMLTASRQLRLTLPLLDKYNVSRHVDLAIREGVTDMSVSVDVAFKPRPVVHVATEQADNSTVVVATSEGVPEITNLAIKTVMIKSDNYAELTERSELYIDAVIDAVNEMIANTITNVTKRLNNGVTISNTHSLSNNADIEKLSITKTVLTRVINQATSIYDNCKSRLDSGATLYKNSQLLGKYLLSGDATQGSTIVSKFIETNAELAAVAYDGLYLAAGVLTSKQTFGYDATAVQQIAAVANDSLDDAKVLGLSIESGDNMFESTNQTHESAFEETIEYLTAISKLAMVVISDAEAMLKFIEGLLS